MTNAVNDNALAQTAEEKRIARGEGTKYDSKLSIVEIAKLVRADIKAQLPGFKVSVKSRGYSGGRSLDVYITGVPTGTVLTNPKHEAWAAAYPHDSSFSYPEEARSRYSVEITTALATLNTIVDAYNYDRCDTMVDYFDVNFYTHIGLHWKFVRDYGK